MAADIEVVSFHKFLHGDDADRLAVAEEIYHALHTVGWVYVKDHGIPQSRVDQIFQLAKDFFSLPLKQKLQYKLVDAELNQGYTADGAETNNDGIDHKECYEHRRFRNPSCPSDSELPEFRKILDEFYNQCLDLGLQVLKCLAIVMKLGDNFFDSITTRADPQLRLIHYPQIDRKMIEQPKHARIMPHTDFGLCTLLFQDSIGGLEVDPFHTGDFKPAKPVPGTVLINIADLLQRLTNDRCRSTLHRVVSPQGEGDLLPARFSIPFFIHPNSDVEIDPIILSPDEHKHYEPVNAGQWRVQHTQRDYGFNPSSSSEPTAIGVQQVDVQG